MSLIAWIKQKIQRYRARKALNLAFEHTRREVYRRQLEMFMDKEEVEKVLKQWRF